MNPQPMTRTKMDMIHDAIQSTREEHLHDWVAVAVWGDSDGEVTVIGEGSQLEMKGYLHSGIWNVASAGVINLEDSTQKSIDSAADVRQFPGGHMDVVRVGGTAIGLGHFEPGWRWSESISPIVGTSTCQLEHVGFVISGQMHVVMDDGEEFELKAGDAIHLAPGHDAWIVGDEPCELLEILSAAEYAKP